MIREKKSKRKKGSFPIPINHAIWLQSNSYDSTAWTILFPFRLSFAYRLAFQFCQKFYCQIYEVKPMLIQQTEENWIKSKHWWCNIGKMTIFQAKSTNNTKNKLNVTDWILSLWLHSLLAIFRYAQWSFSLRSEFNLKRKNEREERKIDSNQQRLLPLNRSQTKKKLTSNSNKLS